MNGSLLLKAAQFASVKHCQQRRKDKEASPYINHPLSVALVVAEVGGVEDEEVLVAALLHDTLEDTETTPEELESLFGKRVRALVEEVTDDKSLPKEERKRLQIDHAPALSPESVLIKLGDKICNVSDVTHSPPSDWDLERRKRYLDWAQAVMESCPRVNDALEECLAETLARGRRILLGA